MTPDEYLLHRMKTDEQIAADRKRRENMAKLRRDRRRPVPPPQRQLEHVREARSILARALQG